MAINIAEDKQVPVQFKKKKKIVFVRCEAVIFDRSEVQKNLCVFGDGVFTGSSCLFLCNLHSQGSPAVTLCTCLTKAERVRQGCPCRIDTNLVLLRNSKDKTC